MHQPWSGETPSLSLLNRKERLEGLWAMRFRATHAQRTHRPSEVGSSSSPHLPDLVPCSSPSPHRSPWREADRGRRVLVIPICLYPNCHNNPPESASIPIPPTLTDPVTGAVTWALSLNCMCWRCSPAPSMAGQSHTGRSPCSKPRHSTLAPGRCSSWLWALQAANIKMPSRGSVFYSSYPTWDEVYVKWVIISFNSLFLPCASTSLHPKCHYQRLSFFSKHMCNGSTFSNFCQVPVWMMYLTRYCIPCFVCLAVFRKWKQNLPLFLSILKYQSTTEAVSHSVLSPAYIINFVLSKAAPFWLMRGRDIFSHHSSRWQCCCWSIRQWGSLSHPTFGKNWGNEGLFSLARYQLLILATQQYFWGYMIALKGPCDVSSTIQKQCIIFSLGHFAAFLPTTLAGFLPYYNSYTENIFISHYLKSRSYQSYINNSWTSMPAMCGNKLYACERKSSGGTKFGTNECKRH